MIDKSDNKGLSMNIAIIILVITFLDYLSSMFFKSQLSLGSYVIYVFFGETLISVVVMLLGLDIIGQFLEKTGRDISAFRRPRAYITIILILLIANLCMPLSRKYNNIVVEGRRPSKIEYYSRIMQDLVSDDAEYINLQKEDIEIVTYQYKARVGRVLRRKTVYSINYIGKDKMAYSFYLPKEEADLLSYVLERYDDINLIYYKKSGVIKALNGAELKDSKRLIEQAKFYEKINEQYSE